MVKVVPDIRGDVRVILVVNSTLQPTFGLRWLLCYEEANCELCHLQKAAPKHWFAPGERIRVARCPTRWGEVSWTTESLPGRGWKVTVETPANFAADMAVHIHPPDGAPLRTASAGTLKRDRILLPRALLAQARRLDLSVLDVLVHT